MDYETAIMVYFLSIMFLAGACAGSFVNCAAERYLAKQSIVRGRSHCPICGHALGVLDLFPILSYVFLRGKCRHCGAKIPVRCLLTECLGGVLYLTVALRFGISLRTLEYVLLLSALFAAALIDADSMEIPDGLLLFAAVIYLGFAPTHAGFPELVKDGLFGALALGGGLLLLSLCMDAILGKESLGGGDVKLFAVLGLFTGLKAGLLLLILACLIGLVFALCLRAKKEFPFGPAIALSAWIVLLAGDDIIGYYLSLFL